MINDSKRRVALLDPYVFFADNGFRHYMSLKLRSYGIVCFQSNIR